MKRPGALVDYESSDDGGSAGEEPAVAPPPKKRRLPTLAPSLVSQAPKDNPALHQGRIRTNPHVEGQYAAYVYVPLRITRPGSLYSLLCKIVRRAKELVPILHAIGLPMEANDSAPESELTHASELHISLTRPVYLRAHQREEFKYSLRAIARMHSPFQASFATFAELTNDERTRTFLTAEIGAGHTELKALCDAITPVLRVHRQKEFYSEPRFHASIAWALLQHASQNQNATASTSKINVDQNSVMVEVITTDTSTSAEATGPDSAAQEEFPTIPHFPPELVTTLEKQFGETLRTRSIGTFECEHLCVRIGKDVTRWKFSA